jgi:hypothetical protein
MMIHHSMKSGFSRVWRVSRAIRPAFESGASQFAVAGSKAFSVAMVESDGVHVTNSGSSEDIEGGADGEIDAALAEAMNGFQILEGAGSSGVSRGNGGPLREPLHQERVDALAKAFHIDRMNQEFSARLSESLHGPGGDGERGEFCQRSVTT